MTEPSKVIHQPHYSVPPDIIYEWVGDEMVIINLKTDRIFSLNKTGARFFDLLTSRHSVSEIKDKLLKEFEVDPLTLDTEVQNIIGKLLDESLIYTDEQ